MHSFLETSTRNTIDNSDIASLVTDAEGVIHLLNTAAEVLLQCSGRQWQGCNLLDMVRGSSAHSLNDKLEAIRRGRLVQEQSVRVECEGRLVFVWLSNHPLFRGSSCVGVIWTLRALQQHGAHCAGDIGRLQRYKNLFQFAALPQLVLDVTRTYSWICEHRAYSAETLQQLLDSGPEPLQQLSDTTRLIEANHSALGLFGADADSELAGMLMHSARESDVRQAAGIALAIYSGESQLEFSYTFTDAAGVRRILHAVCALPTASRIDEGVLVSLLDVTELSDAQAELRVRERFLSATLLAVPDLLFVYDYEASCPIFVNEALRRHLGYDWEEIESLGCDFVAEMVHPDDVVPRENMRDYLGRLAAGEIIEQPVRMRQANGEWRQFQSRAASLEDRGGLTRVGVIIARDITDQLRVMDRVNQQERRYKLLAENFSDIICTTDVKLKVSYLSPSVERVLGYSSEELPGAGRHILAANPTLREMQKVLRRDIARARRERRQPQLLELDYLRLFELEMTHKKGHAVLLEVQCSLMWDEAGALQGLLLVCRDVTQRAEMESDRRLAAKVFENSLEGIYITDAEGRISQINRAFTELTGYSLADVTGQRPSILAAVSRTVSFARVIKPVLETVGYWQGELWSRRSDGSEFPSALGITSVRGKQGEFLGYITTFKDITERRNTEDQIRKLAYYDPLTGLPNRSLFLDRLNQELQGAMRNNSHVALLFLDMDRFKSVNDSMGHAAGDVLLCKIAEKLSLCVRGNDSIARMGGDEFTIILSGFKDRAKAVVAAVSVAHKVREVLGEPMVLHGREVFLSASVGIAVYPQDGEDATTLLQHADVAMYHAKQAGSNNFLFYVEAMNSQALEKLELQNGLYRAAVNHDFRAMYQPIVDLKSGRIIAVETLLRWDHPVRGPISPAEFVPVAEESGLIVRIGQWVLNEACQQMACWLSERFELQWVAVNISARQFAEGNLVRHVNNALDESALPPQFLELELTESILMDNMAYTLEALQDLKSMGVELAIDDFGTGYSSLSYLKQFPIDRLKIDRAFVTGLGDNVEDQRITQAILAIAHSFNLEVVAEGVENEDQLEFLTRQGCEAGQGYLFGHPMCAEDLTEMLRDQAALMLDVPAG